jgi:heme/copper-type cytochrome/quinol oxidase subunit 2
MFNKIQNYLLLHHPLLWNTRIVPMLALTVALNIMFFLIGLADGAINFKAEEEWRMQSDSQFIICFFAIMVGILAVIIWMVYYFRNNAFKSFYPKGTNSLFKEWLIVLAIIILNSFYSLSYLYAKDFRARNYVDEEVFQHRSDIISMSSIFTTGAFKHTGQEVNEVNGEIVTKQTDSFEYRGKKYHINSLLNKTIENFYYGERRQDSINEERVKGWLIENRKDSVLWLMAEFDKIVKAHELKSNITPQQWLKLQYDHPAFTNYINVGQADKFVNVDYDYDDTSVSVSTPEFTRMMQDTLANRVEMKDGDTYIYPKYYVPMDQLTASYEIMSDAWNNPDADYELFLAYLYFSIGLSLAVFSFRVTSGRNWLIAAISLGLFAMFTGIIGVFSGGSATYFIIWLFVITALWIYYYNISRSKQQKEGSGIIINHQLWLLPWILPLIYGTVSIIASSDDYYNRTPFDIWLDENTENMMSINVLLLVALMYLFTNSIKKWKGIAEA